MKNPKTREKNSISHLGQKAWNKGMGVPKSLNYQIRNSLEYYKWRSDVFQRDGWICRTCGDIGRMNAHHKKPFNQIIKENNITTLKDALGCNELWNIDNGITLCIECHKLIGRKL